MEAPTPTPRNAKTEEAYDRLSTLVHQALHLATDGADYVDSAHADLRLARLQMVPTAGPRPVDFDHPEPSRRWTPSSLEAMRSILITAVEGGINDWASVEVYRHQPHDEARAEIVDDEGRRHRIDYYVIDEGLAKIGHAFRVATDAGHESCDLVRMDIASMVSALLDALGAKPLDTDLVDDILGEIDAEAASCIVQVGLFGQVEYG